MIETSLEERQEAVLKTAEASQPAKDHRGFTEYGQLMDSYGATVRVKESSAAQIEGEPPVGRLWVFITGGGISDNSGSSHLTLTQARRLRDLLSWAIQDQRRQGAR